MVFRAKAKRTTRRVGNGGGTIHAAGSVNGGRQKRMMSVRRYAAPEMSSMEKLQATFNTPLEDELYVPVRERERQRDTH